MFPIAVQCSYQLQDPILNVLCGKITQAFFTLFSDGVTGHRAGRGLFVSADHTVPLPLIVMQIIKHVVESSV